MLPRGCPEEHEEGDGKRILSSLFIVAAGGMVLGVIALAVG